MAVDKELEEELDEEMARGDELLERLREVAKRTKKGDTSYIRSKAHYKKTKMVLEELRGPNGTSI